MEPGQEILITDLIELLREAEAGEFGDFSNEKYETPKITLKEKLLALAQNVVDGKYD